MQGSKVGNMSLFSNEFRWLTVALLGLVLACSGGEGSEDRPDPRDMGADAELVPDVRMTEPDEGPACDCESMSECTSNGECEVCSNDDECGENRICTEGACTDGCLDSADCEDAEGTPICNAGRCVACASDDDCFGTATCGAAFTCDEPSECTDSRECQSGRVCLSGACADRPDCNVNFECPNGQDCLEDGTCVIGPDEGCETNADCPRIGDVCLMEGRMPRCGRCRNDQDCGADFRCQIAEDGNLCVERGGCTSDQQCLNGRICDSGDCVAPPCVDDDREDNDVEANATPISASIFTNLVSCDNDPDWYRFNLEAGSYATIQIRQGGLDADLTLGAYNQDGQELALSDTSEPNETVVVGPFPNPLDVFVSVTQVGGLGSTETYTLELTIEDAGADCVEDAVDNSTGDDSVERARQVRQAGQIGFDNDELTGSLCPFDPDVYCFQMNSQESLSAHVSVLSGDAIVLGRLLRPDGESVAEGRWQRSGEQTDIATRVGAGQYCLELTLESGFGSYALTLGAYDTRLEDECAAAQPVSWLGDSMTFQGRLSDDDSMDPQCSPNADGGEYRYAITFDQSDNLPLLVTARASGIAGGSLGDPVLSVRRACANAASEVACSTESFDANDPTTPRVNPAQLKFLVESPGTYFVIVDGRDVGGQPTFRLDLSATSAAADLGTSDLCDAATPELPFNPDGVTSFAVSLDRATDAVSSCGSLNGPDAVYRVNFAEASDVRLQALAVDQGFAVGASLIRDCGDETAVSCGFGFETRVEPGSYFLVVEGVDPHSRGRVTVQMVVAPLGNAASNDTCDEAEFISGSGSLIGTTATASDDYTLPPTNTCTGFNTRAPDVVYRLQPPVGSRVFVRATPVGGWDMSLYVYSDCSNVLSTENRVACAVDGALTEALVFDPAVTPGPYHVIVDGTNGESGEFELTWGAVGCTITDECPEGQVCNQQTYQCN